MIKKLISKIYFYLLKCAYAAKSNNKRVIGTCKSHQPIVQRGKGEIVFGNNVHFGVINAPMFYNTYAYVEARTKDALIEFGDNVRINNSFSAIAEKKIKINNDVLIGYNCSIVDSNFHDLDKDKRSQTDPNPLEVIINRNVFIGNNVTILKGVTIGENSVVSAGAIVTKSFPENVVIGGCPAKIISSIT